MRTRNFTSSRLNQYSSNLPHYGSTRSPFRNKGFRAMSLAVIIIGVMVVGTIGVVAANFFFGSPTTERCMVTGKSVIVSDGDSLPMVDTTCGSFVSWNHRAVSKMQTGATYDIEYSEGFFTIPDVMKSAKLVS